MVLLHESDLLLVRRQTVEGDKWSGPMGLPGGRLEPEDATLLDTALRETMAEVRAVGGKFKALMTGHMGRSYEGV